MGARLGGTSFPSHGLRLPLFATGAKTDFCLSPGIRSLEALRGVERERDHAMQATPASVRTGAMSGGERSKPALEGEAMPDFRSPATGGRHGQTVGQAGAVAKSWATGLAPLRPARGWLPLKSKWFVPPSKTLDFPDCMSRVSLQRSLRLEGLSTLESLIILFTFPTRAY